MPHGADCFLGAAGCKTPPYGVGFAADVLMAEMPLIYTTTNAAGVKPPPYRVGWPPVTVSTEISPVLTARSDS